MLWIFLIGILIVFALAFFIDRKRKKNHNAPHIPVDPDNKPGEDSNYKMGDDDYFSGGGA